MKRKRTNNTGQPPGKKSNTVSGDLRSKIGAKLQTLLNGISLDSRPTSKKHIYDDLLRNNEHSEIIIDPTIVVKTEEFSNKNSDKAQKSQSENFLISAKTKLTELLKKSQGDDKRTPCKISEKDNSLSNDSDLFVVCETCNQNSCSCNLLNRNLSSSHLSEKSSNCDSLLSQIESSNDVVIVSENSKDLDNSTKGSSKAVSYTQISSEQRNKTKEKSRSTQCAQLNCDGTNVKSSLNLLSVNQSKVLSKKSQSTKENFSAKKSKLNKTSILQKLLQKSKSLNAKAKDMELTKTIISELNVEDSEVIDDPEVHKNILESSSTNENNSTNEIVIVGEKQPTYEIITLEDAEDDSDDITIIETLYPCHHCEKSFRAKFLFNFHLKMHELDSTKCKAAVPS